MKRNNSIELDLLMGNKRRHVKITQSFGAGDVWYVLIDKYLHGQLYKRSGEWQGNIRNSDLLYADDISIIGQLIDDIMKPKV